MSTQSALAQSDKQYSLHPYTPLKANRENGPFVISRGDGVYVHDDSGKRYLEGMAGLWCTSLGFSEQRLIDAATQQMQALPYSHLFAHRSTPPAIELAEKLVQMAPDGIERAFFTNSGSEAVDTAIKFAWYYHEARGKPTKKTMIARHRAYHGVTIAAGSLTGLPYAHDGFGLPAIRVEHLTTPHAYREAKPGENDDTFATRLADELEATIQRLGADTIAAFIAEPVMGAGGVLLPPEGYFARVQAVLKRHDILFIADEVICGFARTGNWWGSDTYGIQPDIVTSAKQLSSAYLPIGATLVSGDVYDALEEQSTRLGTFGTGFTYGGHPVAAAVALETLNIYQSDGILEHVKTNSPHFLERVQALQNHPLVGQARGVGLIGAIELVADKEQKTPFPAEHKIAAAVAAAAKEHGVIVRPVPGDTVAFCPPLIIEEEEIDELFDAVTEALNDVWSSVAEPGF
jgi:4-aminobutyrate--pyruvate transaminase